MGVRPEQISLQRKHADGQEAHEKMLNITIREIKIKTTKVSPHTDQNGHPHKKNLQTIQERIGEKGTLLFCCWEGKLIQPMDHGKRKRVPEKHEFLLY